jgi:anti-anti-sigma regulatory factor
MRLSQKQGTLIAMGIQVAGLAISLLAVLHLGFTPIFFIILAVTLSYTLVLLSYTRGWRFAPHLMVILVTLVTGATADLEHGLSVQLLIPAAVALVMTRPSWVFGSAIVTWAMVLIRAGGTGGVADPEASTFLLAVVACMIVARVVTETAQQRAEASVQQAEQDQARTEQQARELAAANQRQEQQLDQQQQLLDLVATLETPAIQLTSGVLFAPIVGHLDSRRAERFTTALLHAAHAQRARLVILDISGVSMVDTAIAQVLAQTAQALQLLGCTVCLSGLSANVAATIVNLGVQFKGIHTVQNPQEALTRYAPTIKLAPSAA